MAASSPPALKSSSARVPTFLPVSIRPGPGRADRLVLPLGPDKQAQVFPHLHQHVIPVTGCGSALQLDRLLYRREYPSRTRCDRDRDDTSGGRTTARNAVRSSRIREPCRSGRHGVGSKSGQHWRQCNRIHCFRVFHHREMAGTAQGDRAPRGTGRPYLRWARGFKG
jgi:hypothetical protein